MLTNEVKKLLSESVLCWLATTNENGEPNCSPKEVFTFSEDDELVIANIASPNSVENILKNSKVCVSLVHIFKQKGFKIKGQARYISGESTGFRNYFSLVSDVVGTTFKVQGFIVINVTSVNPIIAPAYYMVEGTTEVSQISSAKKTYGV